VRIDRYLYCIRLFKSRTLAQTVIETGHVRIDGKRVEKPVGKCASAPLLPFRSMSAFASCGCCHCPTAAARPPPRGCATKSWELTP
jgi:ribosome-associated heat shock protein Hsp15